ncbi:glycine zipper 2TM domain-containing protein [Luteimonas sp. e5]
MNIDRKLLAVALGSLLLGGVSVAAYNSLQTPTMHADMVSARDGDADARRSGGELAPLAFDVEADEAARRAAKPDDVEWAPIVAVKEVTRNTPQYATVLAINPVNQAVTEQQARQVCEDVPVTRRLPERDGNVGGTVAGAVIGGLVGNQLGKGRSSDRRKIETAAGAVGGAFLGRHIDQRHVGGQVVQSVERQCRTVHEPVSRNRVVGYDVTFRNPDGSTGMQRMDSRPGSRISLGKARETTGYDVTYEYAGEQRVVRLDQRPAVDRFKVVDGQVLTRG